MGRLNFYNVLMLFSATLFKVMQVGGGGGIHGDNISSVVNYIARDSHVLNLDKTEYVHTIFCKYILGLSETCSNIAIDAIFGHIVQGDEGRGGGGGYTKITYLLLRIILRVILMF